MTYLSFIWIVIVSSIIVSGCQTASTQTTQPPPPAPEEKKGVYHKVAEEETLWRIAKIYGVKIKEIIETNSIPDVARLEKDQLIFIPGAETVQEVSLTDQSGFAWPLKGKIINYFGRPDRSSINKGIDIRSKEGEIVRASRDGKVVFADYLSGYSYTIILDHLDGYFSVYAQNAKLLVNLGELVVKGAPVSEVGKTGDLAFLHFEIRKEDKADNPLYYLP